MFPHRNWLSCVFKCEVQSEADRGDRGLPIIQEVSRSNEDRQRSEAWIRAESCCLINNSAILPHMYSEELEMCLY